MTVTPERTESTDLTGMTGHSVRTDLLTEVITDLVIKSRHLPKLLNQIFTLGKFVFLSQTADNAFSTYLPE